MTADIVLKEGTLGRTVRTNVRRLREGQRLTYIELASRLANLGRPIPILGLRRIERGQRRVDVDDLAALARAFDVDTAALLTDFDCPTCHGMPPEGFSCRTCGAPEGTPAELPSALLSLRPPHGNLTDGFLKEVAEAYLELVASDQYPSPAIAEQTGAPVATVRRWVSVARKRGFLPEGTQGRVG